jgi:altronate hydrolase
MKARTIQIHPKDNVQVALEDLTAGDAVNYNDKIFPLRNNVKAKHKFAITPIEEGGDVIMYGILVGKAMVRIECGEGITTENTKHQSAAYKNRTSDYNWSFPHVNKFKESKFLGFHRNDGQVGTANYWLVIPLVFCENRNVEVIKHAFLEELGFGSPDLYKSYVRQMVELYKKGQLDTLDSLSLSQGSENGRSRLFKNIDGIKFLTHQGGCGGTRHDAETLVALLAGYIHNPNVAGATVLSLGCQHAQIEILEEYIKKLNPSFSKPLYILEQQKEGTEQELLEKALKLTFLGLIEANKLERKPAGLDKLVIGLECGGSDGFSGISANPAVGHTSDLVVSCGGKTILSEFPELCGVEQDLINRCVDDFTAEKFSYLMTAYSNAAVAVGSGFDMNPSPGNIKDGLITDAIKSAGAAKKGGTSPVSDVLDYGEYVKKPGLNLLCTPGNDVESTTAMAGSGANIILFTTGLGTPTGNPITPVIKISSNTTLAKKMPDLIDFNAGEIISGDKSIEEVGEELLKLIIEVASGERKTKAQQLNQDDFIPWKRGVSL